MDGDFGMVFRLLRQDKEKEEVARRREAGRNRRQKSEVEMKEVQRKVALSHLLNVKFWLLSFHSLKCPK